MTEYPKASPAGALRRIISAIESAIHDKELEKQGVAFDWYVDTDVVVEYLIAFPRAIPSNTDFPIHSLRDKDHTEGKGAHGDMSVAQILLGLQYLPKAKLLWPHHLELKDFVEANISKLRRATVPSQMEVLHSMLESAASESIRELADAIERVGPANVPPSVVVKVAGSLGVMDLAKLDAFQFQDWLSRINHVIGLARYVPTDDGDDIRLLRDKRDALVAIAAQIIEKSPVPEERAHTAGTDAAALLTLNDIVTATRSMPKQRVRFLTFTKSLQAVASDPRSNLLLLDSLESKAPNPDSYCDNPEGVMRSRYYFILRGVMSSLRWSGSQGDRAQAAEGSDSVHSEGAASNRDEAQGAIDELESLRTFLKELREHERLFNESAARPEQIRIPEKSAARAIKGLVQVVNHLVGERLQAMTWTDCSEAAARLLSSWLSNQGRPVKGEELHPAIDQSSDALLQRWQSAGAFSRLRAELDHVRTSVGMPHAIATRIRDRVWMLGASRRIRAEADFGLSRWISARSPVAKITMRNIAEMIQLADAPIGERLNRLKAVCDRVQSFKQSDLASGDGMIDEMKGAIRSLLVLGVHEALPGFHDLPCHSDPRFAEFNVQALASILWLDPNRYSFDEVIDVLDDTERVLVQSHGQDWATHGEREHMLASSCLCMYVLARDQQQALLPKYFAFALSCADRALELSQGDDSEIALIRAVHAWTHARATEVNLILTRSQSEELDYFVEMACQVATTDKDPFVWDALLYACCVSVSALNNLGSDEQVSRAASRAQAAFEVRGQCRASIPERLLFGLTQRTVGTVLGVK